MSAIHTQAMLITVVYRREHSNTHAHTSITQNTRYDTQHNKHHTRLIFSSFVNASASYKPQHQHAIFIQCNLKVPTSSWDRNTLCVGVLCMCNMCGVYNSYRTQYDKQASVYHRVCCLWLCAYIKSLGGKYLINFLP